jgi:hypothetical protein
VNRRSSVRSGELVETTTLREVEQRILASSSEHSDPAPAGEPAHLGVTHYGQSGDLDSVYRHHGIDTGSVVTAALDIGNQKRGPRRPKARGANLPTGERANTMA